MLVTTNSQPTKAPILARRRMRSGSAARSGRTGNHRCALSTIPGMMIDASTVTPIAITIAAALTTRRSPGPKTYKRSAMPPSGRTASGLAGIAAAQANLLGDELVKDESSQHRDRRNLKQRCTRFIVRSAASEVGARCAEGNSPTPIQRSHRVSPGRSTPLLPTAPKRFNCTAKSRPIAASTKSTARKSSTRQPYDPRSRHPDLPRSARAEHEARESGKRKGLG